LPSLERSQVFPRSSDARILMRVLMSSCLVLL